MNALKRQIVKAVWLRSEGSEGILRLEGGQEIKIPTAALPITSHLPASVQIQVHTPEEVALSHTQLTRQLLEEMLNGDEQTNRS